MHSIQPGADVQHEIEDFERYDLSIAMASLSTQRSEVHTVHDYAFAAAILFERVRHNGPELGELCWGMSSIHCVGVHVFIAFNLISVAEIDLLSVHVAA